MEMIKKELSEEEWKLILRAVVYYINEEATVDETKMIYSLFLKLMKG